MPRLMVALIVLIFVLPLLALESVRLLDGRLYDVYSTLVPPSPSKPGAIIVAIDEPSFAEVGARWPWPRDLHARLLRALRHAGARVVGMDVVFSEPSEARADEALAAEAGPEVVFAADEVVTEMPQGRQISVVGPLPALTARGAQAGIASVNLDPDATLRELPSGAGGFAATVLRAAGEPPPQLPAGALIQYFGGPRSYPTVSYYQALDPQRFLPPGFFKDQIVLVGLSLTTAPTPDSGAADAFVTPYTLATRTLTAGVEVQATVLDNLRHGLWVRPADLTVQALSIIAAALGAALSTGRRMTWRTTVAGLSAVAVIVVGSWLLLRIGRYWAPPALPLLAAFAVFAVILGLDFARERQMRRAVSQAFSHYLAPAMVERLARDPQALRLGGERRTLSILFCDIRGFTTLSEAMKDEPEQLTRLVNRLLDPLSEAVLEEGGTIDKYIGDCIMAFWNAPLASEAHAAQAARAALRMEAAVEALNAELAREGGPGAPQFKVGIGVNTGDCVVGNLGSRWRFDYSALGDAVNLAARLEALSKEYGVSIVLGAETRERLPFEFLTLQLDEIAVRGRHQPTAIFTVVDPAWLHGPGAAELLMQAHGAFLEALHRRDEAAAAAAAARAGALCPTLAPYYEGRLAKLAA